MNSTDSWTRPAEPMVPSPYRVAARHVETRDSVTLRLEPVSDPIPTFAPGQFTMLSAFGFGEIAISISGDPTSTDGQLVHTIRAVGAVSTKLHDTDIGGLIHVRGPFGSGWRLDGRPRPDLVLVAGGVGLAPLRPVLLAALTKREHYGQIVLIAGARTPADFLFRTELAQWTRRGDVDVELTVDRPTTDWRGGVGFVTEPLERLRLNADRTTAFLCGPEPMMRFCARALQRKGVPAEAIQVSLERNMQCGIGLCGHCQLGPLLVCRDGPVTDYACAGPLLEVQEL